MQHKFDIPERLPTLNEIISANRTHWAKGADIKKSAHKMAEIYIRAAHLSRVKSPVVVHFHWRVHGKCDPDNIAGGGQKVILDAMQAAGVLPNDNQRWIKGLSHSFSRSDKDGVTVTVLEVE